MAGLLELIPDSPMHQYGGVMSPVAVPHSLGRLRLDSNNREEAGASIAQPKVRRQLLVEHCMLYCKEEGLAWSCLADSKNVCVCLQPLKAMLGVPSVSLRGT
jgi:hypothetical protein